MLDYYIVHPKLKKLLIILIPLLVISLLAFFLLHKNSSNNPPDLASLNDTPEIISIIQKEVGKDNSIEQKFDPPTYTKSIWWTLNGRTIPLDGVEVVMKIPECGHIDGGKSMCETNYLDPRAQKTNSLAQKIFTENDFKPNTENTTKQKPKDGFYPDTYDYILGYENNDFVCIISTGSLDYYFNSNDKTQSHSINISCSKKIDLQKTYDTYLPFSKDLNIDSFTIHKQADNFALLLIGGRSPSGYVLYTKKINGEWTKIFAGQSDIQCSLAQKYDFPIKEFSPYDTCFSGTYEK